MVIITLSEMMVILLMAKQRIKLTRTVKYRKSKTKTDKSGRKRCKTCGAFISGRGKH